uniref:Zgc:113274 n=1 Tax=Acanthochromis polyacanthus TaxID=80966 RepID=A0A3Q1FDH6_9TELE
MPRKYSRKTNWGSTSLEEVQRAATEVQGGKSIRKGGEVTVAGYTGTANAKRVFTEEMEDDLAHHVKKLADHFHGLTAKKSRDVAYEMILNNVPIRLGRDWFINFKACHHLSYRILVFLLHPLPINFHCNLTFYSLIEIIRKNLPAMVHLSHQCSVTMH